MEFISWIVWFFSEDYRIELFLGGIIFLLIIIFSSKIGSKNVAYQELDTENARLRIENLRLSTENDELQVENKLRRYTEYKEEQMVYGDEGYAWEKNELKALVQRTKVQNLELDKEKLKMQLSELNENRKSEQISLMTYPELSLYRASKYKKEKQRIEEQIRDIELAQEKIQKKIKN